MDELFNAGFLMRLVNMIVEKIAEFRNKHVLR
jgi:hypothetical protein